MKLLLDERSATLDEAERLRLEALASGTADVLATWLEGLAALGRPLTGSDLVRLIAARWPQGGRDCRCHAGSPISCPR